MYLKSQSQDENIKTAELLLNDLGVKRLSFSSYSDSNGISVYFRTENGLKCRVSDHSTMNRDRMNEELQVSFDTAQLGLGGKKSIKSNFDLNKLLIKRFGY